MKKEINLVERVASLKIPEYIATEDLIARFRNYGMLIDEIVYVDKEYGGIFFVTHSFSGPILCSYIEMEIWIKDSKRWRREEIIQGARGVESDINDIDKKKKELREREKNIMVLMTYIQCKPSQFPRRNYSPSADANIPLWARGQKTHKDDKVSNDDIKTINKQNGKRDRFNGKTKREFYDMILNEYYSMTAKQQALKSWKSFVEEKFTQHTFPLWPDWTIQKCYEYSKQFAPDKKKL